MSTPLPSLRASKDPRQAEAVAHQLGELLVRSTDAIHKLIRRGDWVAVPTQNSCHLSQYDCERLVEAYRSVGQEAVWAVALEDLGPESLVYRVETTEEGLWEFSHKCGLFNYTLCSRDMSSLVVCTTGDYSVYAGSPQFVGRATGGSLQEVFERFWAYCVDWKDPIPEFADFPHRVYWALFEDYPNAKPGDWVQFPRLNAPSAQG
jgi:hypothetical protein